MAGSQSAGRPVWSGTISFGMVALACLARVALGLHWPSDVLLTSLICMLWIWAAARGVLGKA